MTNYTVYPPTSFPAILASGKLGNKYEIAFSVPGLVERDTIQVETLDAKVIDSLIREKIANLEAIMKLGK